MTDFIEGEGLSFLAHLMRRLSDEFVRGCTEWYPTAGLVSPPRCASTLHALHRFGPLSITDIAREISQSHPMVIRWVRQLTALGLVETQVGPTDKRRTMVTLTPAGKGEMVRSHKADAVIALAYQRLMADADAPVFEALWRMERACRDRPFEDRLHEAMHDLAKPDDPQK
jgi:DNA-binding MarR family transcriptional regulator